MLNFGKLFFASAFALAAPVAANAQSVTLKIAHPYADNHYLSVHGVKAWAAQVSELTNGEVQFEFYPSAQLGRAQVSLLQTGLADISILVPSQEVDALPLSSVMELPGMVTTACEGARKFTTIGGPEGFIGRQELGPLGIRLLYTNMLPPYAVMTKGRAVQSLEDMQGLKLRANGAAIGATMRALGAVPATIPSGEIYDSISRGTIDGAFFPYAAIQPYSLEEQLQYVTGGLALGGAGSLVSISEDTWQDMTPEVQAVMAEAAASVQESLCQWLEDDAERVRTDLAANDGVEFISIPPEEAEEWYQRLGDVVDAWTEQMKGIRKDGAAVLKAFRDADGGA